VQVVLRRTGEEGSKTGKENVGKENAGKEDKSRIRRLFIFFSHIFFSFGGMMPIHLGVKTYRLDEEPFLQLVFEVMRCVFDIHNEFGRFFDEKIYKRELARRYPGVQLEVPIEIRFEDFAKTYFLDALVEGSAAFEFKTVEALVDRHRSQLLRYLFMLDLPHGKLVNMRAEQVQHEFVNATLRLSDRTAFSVSAEDWQEIGEHPIQDWFTAFARDVGAGLDNALYEEALTHLLGGEEQVVREIAVISRAGRIGEQAFHLVEPDVAFKVTSLNSPAHFESQTWRLFQHTDLRAVQWINLTRRELTFQTIRN
jgi:GxxExxY protein